MGIIRALVPALAGIVAVLVAAPAIAADLAPPEPTPAPAPVWTFTAEPYFWMAGMNGRVGVRGLSPADVNVDFSQIFNHIDWSPPPVMLAGEARNG
ncbi:hypothetical protein EN832_34025, partial [Mesorhizobium sp. M1C.F.Ca.ET.189.01.1.1]